VCPSALDSGGLLDDRRPDERVAECHSGSVLSDGDEPGPFGGGKVLQSADAVRSGLQDAQIAGSLQRGEQE
jgi:hypothetical protein